MHKIYRHRDSDNRMTNHSFSTVGVVGAGAMGRGIAQLAAQAGCRVVLLDAQPGAAEAARSTIVAYWQQSQARERISAAQAHTWTTQLQAVDGLSALAGCDLVVEAIVERADAKQALFADLETLLPAQAVLATNTSSLSVTALAAQLQHPERFAGLHFFNPAPLMKVVEIVPGLRTDMAVCERLDALVRAMGHTPVRAQDTPGFIVNRVARPFYGESLRILEEGLADTHTIDRALKEVGGFRMGPFELMDLIGNDINYMVTKTVWESFFYDPRYRPSFTQQRMVQAKWLGRKTGRGVYQY